MRRAVEVEALPEGWRDYFIGNMRDARNMLDPNDNIVIHCSNPSCIASIIGYQILTSMG